jgi:putative membrane protein
VALAGQLTTASALSSWTVQPLAILASAGALGWYLHRSRGRGWPAARTVWFVLGLALFVMVACGPAGHFGRSVYWVWVSQVLALLLVVPLPLMSGQPIALARGSGAGERLARWLESPAGRWLSSPLVGPALVPLICVGVLFGPVPGWVAAHAALGWLLQLVLVAVGAVIVFPLVAIDDRASSVAVGIAVGVGFFELLLDAVPGIVLRLSTHPVSTFFTGRLTSAHAPSWLHDQQTGGGVLWCVAELLDLPFLILIFRRWVRADDREAAEIDAALDAEQPVAGADEPWFLSDPRLRSRWGPGRE